MISRIITGKLSEASQKLSYKWHYHHLIDEHMSEDDLWSGVLSAVLCPKSTINPQRENVPR